MDPPRLELVDESPPDSWSREDMREAIGEVRRAQRELELFGHAQSSPTEVLVAAMLEQLLDETEPETISNRT